MKRQISLLDVKQALLDQRFRETLPESLKPEVDKFLSNPSCGCNHPLYRKLIQTAGEQLAKYYPMKEMGSVEEIVENRNEWVVVSCHIDELQKRLRQLGPGRKQLDIARYQDQVTVVINELDT